MSVGLDPPQGRLLSKPQRMQGPGKKEEGSPQGWCLQPPQLPQHPAFPAMAPPCYARFLVKHRPCLPSAVICHLMAGVLSLSCSPCPIARCSSGPADKL